MAKEEREKDEKEGKEMERGRACEKKGLADVRLFDPA